jgi:hypothetical protein
MAIDNPHGSLEALELLRQANGSNAMRPPMFGDKVAITAKISGRAKAGLRRVAKNMGYVHNGHGNINLLLEAIGTGTVVVRVPNSL